ncbi:MAG: amino acid--tRNA ligase-related protein, partial [Pseudomonadota bacterium]|nr:amino acid--tRNA ligase-related protein [Pseudomonadota bacterium]
MNWWLPHKFEEKRNFLMQRAALQSAIRTFFTRQGFVEVTTPVLQVCPVMDAHIHGFATTLKGVDLRDKGTLYLQTSPEFDMKKLLVAGMPRIFQLCPVFRNAEGSRLHSPEFTMLEWYRTHSDYND